MSNLIKHLASRLCLRGTGIFCLCLMLSQPVSASISSITIDANTGKVISANNADELRYPASLTKLMTLYITFDALEKGLIKLDDEFPVSRKAANRAPSRLGLRPGSKIKVKTAIEALIIRSANDCATVLAEGLGYSEENFAKTMTEVAHALGMENTTFKNASGLPNRQQKTTARDMAILGAAMYHHFPQYYKWFSLRKFTYEGKTYYTHNHVLKQFEGADGMKTGFTNAAGFNIITSADRNGQRVIAVTMGHRTQKDRDKKVINMMDKGLTRLALESSQSQSSTLHADLIEEHNQPVAIDTQLADNAQLSSSDNENEENAHPEIEQGSTDSDQIIKAEETNTPVWSVQIGAFSNYAKARNYAKKIKDTKLKKYTDCNIEIEAVQTASAIVYRSKISGFEKNDAQSACKHLKSSSISCIVTISDSNQSMTVASRE